MYVIKVGEYYVRNALYGEVTLSMEMMRSFNKEVADKLAEKLNGELIEIAEEVTCE